MVDGLSRVAGNGAEDHIRWQPDARISKIVAGRHFKFDLARGRTLGFDADRSVDDIIRPHIDDKLGGKFAD